MDPSPHLFPNCVLLGFEIRKRFIWRVIYPFFSKHAEEIFVKLSKLGHEVLDQRMKSQEVSSVFN